MNHSSNYFHVDRRDQFIKCKAIGTVNITAYLHTGLAFEGIPENTILNVICFLFLFSIFMILKTISWMRRHYKPTEVSKIGWIGLLYRDVYAIMPEHQLQALGSRYVPINKDFTYFQMLKYCLFEISDHDIMVRCGVDANQYLTFHRYIMYYMVLNTVVCICIILPANVHGNTNSYGMHDGYFARTTMANLYIGSPIMWCHVVVAFVSLLSIVVVVRAISLNLLHFEGNPWSKRTIWVRKLAKKHLSSRALQEYLESNYPEIEIDDIKFVYDYQRFLEIDTKLQKAKDNMANCRRIMREQSREVKVSIHTPLRALYHKIRNCCRNGGEKINGERYYALKVKRYKKARDKELKRLPKTVKRSAFVTLRSEPLAYWFLSKQPKYLFHNFGRGKWTYLYKAAPEPTDIIWENVKKDYRMWSFHSIFVNLAIFFVAFFATTPGIVISSFKLDKIKEVASTENIILSRFLVSIIVWSLSTLIPLLIIRSSELLEFETKTSLHRSVVIKTFVFMAFTVVILPSLGQTSLDGFTRWTLTKYNQTYDWSCIFLVDNGVFFVDYVITTTFIGTTVQLLRLPELVWCGCQLLAATSEVETVSIRKESIWPFAFGIQYGYSLLLFTVVTFFSLPCPVISVFGTVYFVFRYLVDKHNIYFSSSPSRISPKIHALVIKLVVVAIAFKFSGFFFLVYIRGGWEMPVTYVASVPMWISIVFALLVTNPCGWTCDDLPKSKMKSKQRPPHENKENEVYQPVQFRKCLHRIRNKDEHNNPLESKREPSSSHGRLTTRLRSSSLKGLKQLGSDFVSVL